MFVLSTIIFVVSSENVLKLEKQKHFDYANPVYVFLVLAAVGSVVTGGFSLIELHRFATEKLLEKK